MSARIGKDSLLNSKTLWISLLAFRGRVVTAETRNNGTIVGSLDEVDEKMNMLFSDVVMDRAGAIGRKAEGSNETFMFNQLYVNGRHVVMVQFPDGVDVDIQVDKHQNQLLAMRTSAYQKRRATHTRPARV